MSPSVGIALVALLGTAAALDPYCDVDQNCRFEATVGNQPYYFDFSPLCRTSSQPDYTFDDGAGHTYFANICGVSKHRCLPAEWLATFEIGVAVQFFGDTPPCNYLNASTLQCTEKVGQTPTCCSADCQVLGVGEPTYLLMNAGQPTMGVAATFDGAPPDDDDPFWCPWNPATGQQFPRQVQMDFLCDNAVNGAVELLAIENSTEHCKYTLQFATNLACPVSSAPPVPSPNPTNTTLSTKLSGGWVFVLFVVVASFVYIVAGMGIVRATRHKWEFPNASFWENLGNYVNDGITVVLHCKTSAVRGTTSSYAGVTGNPYDASSVPTAPASSKFSSGGTSGGYHGAPSSAYTDI